MAPTVASSLFFFFQAEDGIRDYKVTGVQTCALPISAARPWASASPACLPVVTTVEARAGRPIVCRDRRHDPGSSEEGAFALHARRSRVLPPGPGTRAPVPDDSRAVPVWRSHVRCDRTRAGAGHPRVPAAPRPRSGARARAAPRAVVAASDDGAAFVQAARTAGYE